MAATSQLQFFLAKVPEILMDLLRVLVFPGQIREGSADDRREKAARATWVRNGFKLLVRSPMHSSSRKKRNLAGSRLF